MSQELSEAKQIEYDRRVDSMWAISRLAAQFELQRREKQHLQKECVEKMRSKWLIGFVVLAVALHWAFPDSNAGLVIGIFCGITYLGAFYDEQRAQDHLFHLNHRLATLNCEWASVAGIGDLEEIRKFVANDYFDYEDEDYRAWMRHNLQYVLDELQEVPYSQRVG